MHVHSTCEILDLAKTRNGIPSDYKLGLTLGLASDSAISNYRNRRSYPNDEIAATLADLAGLDRGYTLACIHAERTANGETRNLWRAVASRLSSNGVAAAVILSLSFWGGGPDGGAMAAEPQALHADAGNRVCIM